MRATSVYYFAFAAASFRRCGGAQRAIPLFTFVSALVFLRSEPVTPLRLDGVLIGWGVLLIASGLGGPGQGVALGGGPGRLLLPGVDGQMVSA